MKRRSLLFGGASLAAAAGGATLLWKPEDRGAPHNEYFSNLNELLKRDGPGRPVMLLDADRVDSNVDVLASSVGPNRTYRVVVKSLPSVPLLQHVMQRAKTNALMVFHQPFLNAVADAFPEADALLGKPMPVSAAETFYQKLGRARFDAANQVQWLIDSPERLLQYHALARRLGVKMRINFEIDVGLHRGGLPEPEALGPLLKTIQTDPEHLSFSGFMGYEPHLTGLGAALDHPAVQSVLGVYRGFMDNARAAGVAIDGLTLNGAGSHTLRIYDSDNTMNDLAAGSGVVKPTDFDTYHLTDNLPAFFIATPILKRYDQLKVAGDPWIADFLPWWDPNMRRLYYIYGGLLESARRVACRCAGPPVPEHQPESDHHLRGGGFAGGRLHGSCVPLRVSSSCCNLAICLTFRRDQLVGTWPVFHQTG